MDDEAKQTIVATTAKRSIDRAKRLMNQSFRLLPTPSRRIQSSNIVEILSLNSLKDGLKSGNSRSRFVKISTIPSQA
jgi:hypothetical protein